MALDGGLLLPPLGALGLLPEFPVDDVAEDCERGLNEWMKMRKIVKDCKRIADNRTVLELCYWISAQYCIQRIF